MKKTILFILLAIGSAAFLVFSGIDWWWARMSWRYLFLQYTGIPSVFIGMLLPVALPLYFYLNRKNQHQN